MSDASNEVSWPAWKIALAIGVPVGVVSLGAYYFLSQSEDTSKKENLVTKRPTRTDPEGSASSPDATNETFTSIDETQPLTQEPVKVQYYTLSIMLLYSFICWALHCCVDCAAVNSFCYCYLGDMISACGGCESAVITRARTAWGKYIDLLPILSSKSVPLKTKGRVLWHLRMQCYALRQ